MVYEIVIVVLLALICFLLYKMYKIKYTGEHYSFIPEELKKDIVNLGSDRKWIETRFEDVESRITDIEKNVKRVEKVMERLVKELG